MNLLDGEDQNTNDREEILNKWKDKSKEEILEGKINSDLYVKTIERQKDELRDDYLKQREELLAKAKFEELIDRFEKAPKDNQVATPLANEESQKYDIKEFETLIENKLRQSKLIDKETENFTKVENKLQEKYGDNYRSILKEQQSTLGLSSDDVNNLAKKSPEAFFRLMGLNDVRQQESFQAPPKSGQRNDSFAPRGPAKRDYAYYQELKKADPLLYLKKDIAVQMHNDVLEMGEEAFYGTKR